MAAAAIDAMRIGNGGRGMAAGGGSERRRKAERGDSGWVEGKGGGDEWRRLRTGRGKRWGRLDRGRKASAAVMMRGSGKTTASSDVKWEGDGGWEEGKTGWILVAAKLAVARRR